MSYCLVVQITLLQTITKKNYRKDTMNVRCNGETGNFTTNDVEKTAKELTCDLRVIEEVEDNVFGCVDKKWTAVRYGYVDPTEKKSFLLGEVCYDMIAGNTRFVHTILGDKTSDVLDKKPSNYLSSGRHPDGRYKIELFSGMRFDNIYERLKISLQTKQIPQLKMDHFIDESLLFNEQYQAIKKLSWNYYVGYDENEVLESLKSDIQRLSKNLGPLDLYVGSHGVKKFYGANGVSMDLYLHQTPNRFPMPELLWFVVKHENKATAFSVWNEAQNVNRINNPNPDENKWNNNLCKNSKCDMVSWLSDILKNDEHLICCDVQDLRTTVQEIPILVDVAEMLI